MYGWVAWFSHESPPPIRTIVPNASELLRQAYEEQTTIGWKHVMRGRLARSWETVNGYESRNGKK